jgi:hypothetical protein
LPEEHVRDEKPAGRILMKINSLGYRMVSAIALLWAAGEVHALTLTKDTVYESIFTETDPNWAIWNDSTSLINNTGDTVSMESILFLIPKGKYAELGMGYGKAYRKEGSVGGAVLHAGRPYDPIWDPGKTIPPGARVPITGFQMANCIECPLEKGAGAGDDRDTLIAYLIFDTQLDKDTLVVIGEVSKGMSGIRIPYRPREMKRGGMEFRNFRYFDFLGRFRLLHSPTPG